MIVRRYLPALVCVLAAWLSSSIPRLAVADADEPQDQHHWRTWYGAGGWSIPTFVDYGYAFAESYGQINERALVGCRAVWPECSAIQIHSRPNNVFDPPWNQSRVVMVCAVTPSSSCWAWAELFSPISACGTFNGTNGTCSNYPPLAPTPAESQPLEPYSESANKVCKGNPCSPSDGNKFQTFLDYEAPGIRFTRSWRSNPSPRTAYAGHWSRVYGAAAQPQAVLPWGWTHSYAMKVLFNGSTLETLYRPDGSILQMSETSSGSAIYLATNGSGVQARGSSTSNVTVYLPDGSKELYVYRSCSGLLVPGHRLEQVIDPAGRVTQLEFAVSCNVVGPPTRIVGPFGHSLEIHYNTATGTPRPFIDYLVDSAGETIEFAYTTKTVAPYSDALLDTVTYQDGTELQHLYADNTVVNRRRLTGLIDEEGIEYSEFTYDASGRATSTQRTGGYFRWTLTYNANGTNTATDARNISTVYAFQNGVGTGRVVGDETRSRMVRSKSNETTAQHRLLTDIDERGVKTSYAYDTYHLTDVIEADDALDVTPRATHYEYLNETSQLRTLVERPSVCVDGTPRLKVTDTAYMSGTQLVDEQTENGWVDQSGTCQSISRTTQIEYGTSGSFTRTHGLPTAIRGPRMSVADDIVLTYHECLTGDECGQIETMTNAAGHVWSFDTYDAHGGATQITLPTGAVVTNSYDLRGRLETTAESAGSEVHTTEYTYYLNGLPRRVTDPAGGFLERVYNDARLLTDIFDNENNRIEYDYDLAGNRTDELMRDPTGAVTWTKGATYDDFNRLDTVLLPNPNGWDSIWDYDYDAVGLLERVESPDGRTTTYDNYDSFGRLVSYLNALDQRTTYAYDDQDNVVSVTALTTSAYPAGVVTSYVYDDFGRQVSETSADRGVLTRAYDVADNLELAVDARGLSSDYVYDALNRLRTIQVEPQGGGVQETLSIDYDDVTAGGRRGQIVSASAQNGDLIYTYDYDAFGRLALEQLASSGLNTPSLTQYTYDSSDRIFEIRRGTPAQPDLWVTRNVRDATGLLTDVEDRRTTPADIVGNVQHMPFGPYESMTWGNGTDVAREIDQRYRVTGAMVPGIHGFALGWTADDNIFWADWANGWWWSTHHYDTDALNRVTAVRDTDLGQELLAIYDENGQHGNLTQQTLHWMYDSESLQREDYTYTGGTNRLEQISYTQMNSLPDSYPTTLDPSGNLIDVYSYLPATYEYDSLSQLRVVTGPTAVTGRYDFDHQGQRVRKVTYPAAGTAETTLFSYLPDGKLLGEVVFTNNLLSESRDYVWMEDTPVAMHVLRFDAYGVVTADQTYYLHADHLDTPRSATNSAGTEIWNFAEGSIYSVFDGYVANLNGGPISPINLRFPGQYFDSEAWLNYNYHRHYWPHVGRYVQHDPIGLEGGLNPYLYANANPLRYTDPTGLQAAVALPPAPPPAAATSSGVQGPPSYWEIEALKGLYDSPQSVVIRCFVLSSPLLCPMQNDEGESCPVPDTTFSHKTGGKLAIRTKPGDFGTANDDFDAQASGVSDKGGGIRAGTLPDGRMIVVRPGSRDGRPTIEIQRGGRKRIEIRYGPK